MEPFIPQLPESRVARFGDRGFTLIELLATIGIIAMLAALTFPALGRLKSEANTAACLSHLRECGVLIHLYSGDHDNYFPPATSNNQGYVTALNDYLSKSQAAMARNLYVSPSAAYPTSVYGGTRFTYAVHNALFGGAVQSPLKTTAVTHPTQVIMMANGAQFKDYGYSCAFTFYQPWEMNQGSGHYAAGYLDKPIPADDSTNVDDGNGVGYLRYVQNKNTAVNCLMVDGHAETIKKGKVLYRNVVYDQ